jgi:hypothetical protein
MVLMPDLFRRGIARIAGIFPSPVEGDLNLVEFIEAGEGSQLGALEGRDQPQFPVLVLFDLQFMEWFGVHDVLFPFLNSIIGNFQDEGFKGFVRFCAYFYPEERNRMER